MKSVCFIDFQITRYCSPALDLLYHIFTATDKPFRQLHYEDLLKTYYTSLSDTIRKLGSDPDKLYTYENLQSQLSKFAEYALLMAPMMIWLTIAARSGNIGSIDEYTKVLEVDDTATLIAPFDEQTELKYSTWINDLVTDMINYGYIGNK